MWNAQRQKSIALSSAEAEIVALSEAARDAVWLRQLHTDIGLKILHPTPLLEDSGSALSWATGRVPKWSAARHVPIRDMKVRELKRDGTVLPRKVSTHAQLADALTKALPHATFTILRTRILGMQTTTIYDLRVNDPAQLPYPAAAASA